MDLSKYGVRMLDLSSVPYSCGFLNSAPAKPVLDARVAAWRDGDGKPFPESDLIAQRVGFHSLGAGGLSINCYPVSWGQYMLMSKAAERATLPDDEKFHCLSVACLAETSDGHFVLSFRSRKNVSHYKNMWHVSAAGYVDLGLAQASQSIFPQVFRELEEELGVLPSHVQNVRQLGVCEHLVADSASVEVLMFAQVSLAASEVVERSKKAVDSWEGKVSTFPKETVREMLGRETFNPAAAVTLLIALK